MTTTVSSPVATAEVAVIPVADIRRSGNVRQDLVDIESLAESIRQHGVLTAILVERRQDGGFELVAGFRRVAAAMMAGLEHIPAVVRDPVEGVQRVSDQVAENDDRCALTALDVAGAMQQMLDLGASKTDVAKRFATNTDTIDGWRAVLALPAPLLALVRQGTIDVTDVADLGELADDEEFVAAVVAEIRAGTGPRWAVSRVRQQRVLALTAAASQAKLEKEGCPIVAAPRYDTVTGNSRMQRLGDAVKVSLRQHRKQPCHAAFISGRGEVAYVSPTAVAMPARPAVAFSISRRSGQRSGPSRRSCGRHSRCELWRLRTRSRTAPSARTRPFGTSSRRPCGTLGQRNSRTPAASSTSPSLRRGGV